MNLRWIILHTIEKPPGTPGTSTLRGSFSTAAPAECLVMHYLGGPVFTIRVAVQVRPEGRDAFAAQLKKEEQEVPATFAGCQRFAVYRAPGDPASFLLYEEWADRKAADAYLTSEYFQAAAAVVVPLIDGQPDSAYYESQRVGP